MVLRVCFANEVVRIGALQTCRLFHKVRITGSRVIFHSCHITPSCSPGNLLTRFCSQLSKSFAANLCRKVSSISHRPAAATHVVLLLHIDFPLVLANPQLFFLRQLPDFSIESLIAKSGRWREEERAQQHGRDEGQAEKCEWMSC